ncbi:MAG: S10 family peptidase [Candidatus Binatia bacterium]
MIRYLKPLAALMAIATFWGTGGSYAVEGGTGEQRPKTAETALPKPPISTDHKISINNRILRYTATAGSMIVKDQASKVKGRFFFVAYTLDGASPAKRPISFAFNGGPGAASAFLHLGALGPKRMVLNDDGTAPRPPAQLTENKFTWLAFTDLVFIDPIGTGYSRNASGKKEDNKVFWGVKQDAVSIAEFIRLYLTRYSRWLSPKLLVGESYGGIRSATLAHLLQRPDFGIDLNGLVLISPVLEYALTQPGDFNLLPWVILLPTYSATAIHHHLSTLRPPGDENLERALAQVETFATNKYLTYLFRGDSLNESERATLQKTFAGYTGLSVSLVTRNKARIPSYTFTRELLRNQGLILGAYDTSVTGVDPDPGSPFVANADPTLNGLSWPFVSTFNAYVRDELGYDTDVPYILVNDQLVESWDWHTGIGSSQGFVTTAGGLKLAMTVNPNLKVFVGHGYFDLVTPYFGTQYVIDQLALPKSLRANITIKRYRAGHMIYTHREAREQLYRDVRKFYAEAVP